MPRTPDVFFAAARNLSVNDPERLRLLARTAIRQARLDEGDFIELGVYRGGSALLLAHAVKTYSPSRTVHLLDSWKGLPEPTSEDAGTIASAGIFSESSKRDVELSLRAHDLQDVCTLSEGWFSETLPHIQGPFSFAHIDCDFYAPAKESLAYLLPRMTRHAMIVLDDYGTQKIRRFPGVEQAVREILVTETGRVWKVVPLGGERDESALLVRKRAWRIWNFFRF